MECPCGALGLEPLVGIAGQHGVAGHKQGVGLRVAALRRQVLAEGPEGLSGSRVVGAQFRGADLERLAQQYVGPTGEGLGDAAYWDDRTDRMDLYVLESGDVTIWIRFQDRGKATQVDEARRLGEAVLPYLK